jgi:hypothetical protein
VDQSVQYALRNPFFISSRLMPAIRVGDATIHMRADSVDSEDFDPIVRWQYIIAGTDVDYEASDVSTDYLGRSTIAGQLPWAMSTLLTFLSHAADANVDDAVPFPAAVCHWARRNSDEITMMLDVVENPDQHRMSASELWRAITHDPYQTPYGRWCGAQAVAHADRLSTLNPPTTNTATAKTGLAVRDELWHETAVAWYTMLTNQPEPDHTPPPLCTVADRDTIHAWLRQPAPEPHIGTIKQLLDLDHRDEQWYGPLGLPALIEHAQREGLFGIRDHTIRLHNVFDHTTGSNGNLLTIHTPSGVTVAAGPFAIDLLLTHGWVDEATVLGNCATAINSAFASPAPPAATAPDRARPFPPLGTEPAVSATAGTVSGSPVFTAHRRR